MASFNVNYKTDRNGNQASAVVEIPDSVPAASVKRAIQLRLQAQTNNSEIHDIVIMKSANLVSGVECAIPANENIDIVAAGY